MFACILKNMQMEVFKKIIVNPKVKGFVFMTDEASNS